jgi:deoxyhypusine synthase
MMVEAKDFDSPVEDYDFDSIRAAENSVDELFEQMSRAGGFSATKLASARTILEGMWQPDGTIAAGGLNWLSFPAALCATGTRGFFVDSIRNSRFNLVVTTCGTLDHDIARSHQDYFHGSFDLDDVALGAAGLNRLGNVIVPNSSYGEVLEAVLLPLLEQVEQERRALQPDNPWAGYGSVELAWDIGRRISDESSLLHWAAVNEIPVVVPGIWDGAVGAQLFMHRQRSPGFNLDLGADQQRLSDLVWTCDSSHALMIGGGISKHHVIWWNQYRGGLDSAVQITTAVEWDGSLSGARPREAISWGKLKPEAQHVTVEGDASLLLPLLGAVLFS